MEKTKTVKSKKQNYRKKTRELLLTISVFLLNHEAMRKQFWTVKSAFYDHLTQTVKIGVNTTNGKHGTTLSRLRKTSKELSEYLYEHGLTFRKTAIVFFIDKQDVELERIYSLINKVENK